MWATGVTHMIARVTSSTLFANQNLAYIVAHEHRSVSTSSDNVNVLTKMRDLRARSPFALFVKDNYSEISGKYPNLKLSDITKKVAEVWKTLPDTEKQTYIKKSQGERENYEQEKKLLTPNDLQTLDAAGKAKRIQTRIKKTIQQLPTKRPRPAFSHFLATLDRGEADLATFMKGASQRWSHLTVQDKQKFEDLAQEEKQKYVKELVAWDALNNQKSKPRSSSASSTKTKDVKVKKPKETSVTTKRVAKRTTGSSKPTSDKESSSSSSDDESSSKTKK